MYFKKERTRRKINKNVLNVLITCFLIQSLFFSNVYAEGITTNEDIVIPSTEENVASLTEDGIIPSIDEEGVTSPTEEVIIPSIDEDAITHPTEENVIERTVIDISVPLEDDITLEGESGKSFFVKVIYNDGFIEDTFDSNIINDLEFKVLDEQNVLKNYGINGNRYEFITFNKTGQFKIEISYLNFTKTKVINVNEKNENIVSSNLNSEIEIDLGKGYTKNPIYFLSDTSKTFYPPKSEIQLLVNDPDNLMEDISLIEDTNSNGEKYTLLNIIPNFIYKNEKNNPNMSFTLKYKDFEKEYKVNVIGFDIGNVIDFGIDTSHFFYDFNKITVGQVTGQRVNLVTDKGFHIEPFFDDIELSIVNNNENAISDILLAKNIDGKASILYTPNQAYIGEENRFREFIFKIKYREFEKEITGLVIGQSVKSFTFESIDLNKILDLNDKSNYKTKIPLSYVTTDLISNKDFTLTVDDISNIKLDLNNSEDALEKIDLIYENDQIYLEIFPNLKINRNEVLNYSFTLKYLNYEKVFIGKVIGIKENKTPPPIPPVVEDNVPPIVEENIPPVVVEDIPPIVEENIPPVVVEGIPPIVEESIPPVITDDIPSVIEKDTLPIIDKGTLPVIKKDISFVVMKDTLPLERKKSFIPLIVKNGKVISKKISTKEVLTTTTTMTTTNDNKENIKKNNEVEEVEEVEEKGVIVKDKKEVTHEKRNIDKRSGDVFEKNNNTLNILLFVTLVVFLFFLILIYKKRRKNVLK